MDLLRVQTTSMVTLTKVFKVDEVVTDVTGNVTVTVKRLDGTQITGSPFTAAHPSTGTYTFPLPGQPLVDTFTVDWAGLLAGSNVVLRDYVEIVGGFYFGLDEARNQLTGLVDRNAYPASLLAMKRIGVEQECDRISGHAWVPRFARFVLDGSGTDTLVVPDMFVRSVRAASVADVTGGTFAALDTGALAAIAAADSGLLIRADAVWLAGRRNVIVEYEHGLNMPAVDVHDAALLRLKSFVNRPKSGIPDRALQYTTETGTVYRLTASGPRSTGIPDVDAAYRQNKIDKFWLAG